MANVWASQGIVSAGHPLASQAGLCILHRGGNAVDAALAMAFATIVVQPGHCGLGGDAYALYSAPSGSVTAVMGSGGLPAAYAEDRLNTAHDLLLPLRGPQSVTVPGAAGAYLTLHRRFGRLDLSHVMASAISLASDGFLVDDALAASLARYEEALAADPALRQRFYPAGVPLRTGDVLRQPELADLLRALAAGDADAFYRGAMGRAIERRVAADGGFLSHADLAEHRTRVERPLTHRVGGYTVMVPPPPSSGIVLLEALDLLAADSWDPEWRSRSEPVHRMIEALRWSFYDLRRHLGDPDFVGDVAQKLLAADHLQRRRSAIHEGKSVLPEPVDGGFSVIGGDTASLVAADADGGAVGLIHSLGLEFGSLVYVAEGGFFLNNRAGRSFNRVHGHPNQALPKKRPLHALHTYVVQMEQQTVLVGNTPGGDGQAQWNLTILTDLLWAGRTPSEAVSLPRLTISPGTEAHSLGESERVVLESRFSPRIWAELGSRGHQVRVVGPYEGGGAAHVLQRRPAGWVGATDPRGVGQTLGF